MGVAFWWKLSSHNWGYLQSLCKSTSAGYRAWWTSKGEHTQLQGCPFTCMRDKKFSLAWVNHFHIDLGSNPSYLCHQMACEVVTVHQRNEDSIKCTWVTERFLQVPLPGVLKSAIESLDSFLQTSGLDLRHKFLGCPSKFKRHSHGERQLWRLPHCENSKQNSIYCIRGT